MLNNDSPITGSLLLSEPFMLDPNFKRAVILLTEHNADGTIGYVLNQQSNLILSDVFPDCPEADFPIFVGGPVANNTLHFIHQCNDRMNSGEHIKNNVYWGGNFEVLKILINNKQIGPNEIRFFTGYSGWGPDQLNSELNQNSWLVSNFYNTDLLFNGKDESLWKEAVKNLGEKFAHIVHFPQNPFLN